LPSTGVQSLDILGPVEVFHTATTLAPEAGYRVKLVTPGQAPPLPDVAVVHLPKIKPLDREAILKAARPDRLVAVLENHPVVGGLAESIAACLAFAREARSLLPIDLPDAFPDAGALPTLHDRYGLSTDRVVASVRVSLGR
jgi:deoxyxylulose-5-phosphate synthase